MRVTAKLIFTSAVFTVGILSMTDGAKAQGFTAGDLVVERVNGTSTYGAGAAALSSAGTAVFVDEFGTTASQTAPALTISLPTAANGSQNSFVDSGSATSDGYLTRSVNGQYLSLTGYNAAVGTASVVAGTEAHVVGRIDASGNVDTSTSSTTANTGNNTRGAASVDGNTFYTTGSGSAAVPPTNIFTFGGTTATGVATTSSGATVTNIRNDEIFTTAVSAQSLYYSTGSGTAGIYMYTGLPTSTAATSTLLVTDAAGKSPYGFSISPDGKTVYVADDSSGIMKYTSTTGAAGSFALAATYATTKARGLVVDYSGANPILYATSTATSANTLFSITDDGSASDFANQNATTLATAPANTAFRGVDFAPTPVPEPATYLAGAMSVLIFAWSLRRRGAQRVH